MDSIQVTHQELITMQLDLDKVYVWPCQLVICFKVYVYYGFEHIVIFYEDKKFVSKLPSNVRRWRRLGINSSRVPT